MKLKSKLIATIVSICAAIAVMGVGVWAATSSFTVTVTNQISLGFDNLGVGENSKITVTAKAGADVTGLDLSTTDNETDTKSIADLNEVVLYGYDADKQSYAVKYNAISSSETVAGTNLQWLGADFLSTYNTEDGTGYITDKTKAAAIDYTFTYTPDSTVTTGTGSISVTVTEITAPPTAKGAKVEAVYYVSNDGTNWYPLTSGTAVVAGAYNATIRVRAICQYSNENLVSASASGSWQFSVQFTAGSADYTSITGTSTTIGELTNGAVAIPKA